MADFNSIKVRLNLTDSELSNKQPPSFQFHKGTIKPCFKLELILLFPNFNSIKVRLNHSLSPYYLDRILFQFHKGTIKPNNSDIFSDTNNSFQFHKGTIKPLCRK